MTEYFAEPKSSGGRKKVELDSSNYVTKPELKNAVSLDTLKISKKVDLADLKSNVEKLDIDKLKNAPTNLSNLKSKTDELNVDKLVFVPVDLSKLSDVVKNDIVKKDVYNPRIKNIEDEILDSTNLATNITLNAKRNEVKGETPSITNLTTAKINEVKHKISNITNLATTIALATVENKIPNVINLVKSNNTKYNIKVSEIENKITTDLDYDKYITIQEFNKSASENFTASLKQANFASKNILLISLKRPILIIN